MRPRHYASWLVLGVLTTLCTAASAQTIAQTQTPTASTANVLYPLGSRLGIAPPPGLQPSRVFPGFEDRENNVYVRLVVIPAPAYEQAVTSPEKILGQQVAILERRDDITLADGSKGTLVILQEEIDGTRLHKWILLLPIADVTALVSFEIPDTVRGRYPETAIRAALVSITAREEVPTDEMLQLLPFRMGELAGLRVVRVVPGLSVELSDAAKDIFDRGRLQMKVSAAPGGPTDTRDRDKFAQLALRGLPPLRDVRIIGSESLRIAGQPGHELRAEARDPTSGQNLQIVQWLRFGTSGYLHIIAFATKDHWADAFTRFRAIRDGILPR